MIIEIEQNDIVAFYTAKMVQTCPRNGGLTVTIDGTNFTVRKGGTITVRTDHGKTLRVLGLSLKPTTGKQSLSERNRAIMEVLKPGDKEGQEVFLPDTVWGGNHAHKQ